MVKTNEKGFTLIELLAVIIIMGVLLIVAIPAVTKYIEQSRRKAYASALNGYVDSVRNEVNNFTDEGPNRNFSVGGNDILYIPFDMLDLEGGDKAKSSYGSPFATYEMNYSYIVVVPTGTGYKYFIQALDSSKHGVKLVPIEQMSQDKVVAGLKEEDLYLKIAVGSFTTPATLSTHQNILGLKTNTQYMVKYITDGPK